jgi:hypothetical protein
MQHKGTNALKDCEENPMFLSCMSEKHRCFIICVIVCVMFVSLPLTAQPSGGPYGPIRQRYDLPKGAGKIYYVAPDGKAEATGETLEQPTTLEATIERVPHW